VKTLPTITCERVLLRPLRTSDVDAIFTIFSNPKVMRYWSTPPLPDRNSAEMLTKKIVHDVELGSMMKWGVARMSDDTVVGTVTLFHIDLDNGRAELGYALAQESWGQGYMGEALRSLVDYTFNTLNLRRLEADVDPRNGASIRTLERLGFQREGFLRERWHVAGEIQDALFYGLLKREWQNSL
jgi:ribosomal-protein-alanine N-acetyltransferase